MDTLSVRYVTLLAVLLFSLPSWSATVADLFEVEWPVQTQDRSERIAVISKACEELLIRITGKNDVVENFGAADMIKNGGHCAYCFG